MTAVLKENHSLSTSLLKSYLNLDFENPCTILFRDGFLTEINSSSTTEISHQEKEDSHCFNIGTTNHILNKINHTTKIIQPIFIIHYFERNQKDTQKTEFKKNSFHVSPNSEIIMVELFLYEKIEDILGTFHTEFLLEKNSKLQHIQYSKGQATQSLQANVTIKTDINLKAFSTYHGSAFSFNIEKVQNYFNINLNGKKAKAEFQALILEKLNQQGLLFLNINHKESECQSKIMSRGVLKDQSKGEFKGTILIEKNATQSSAELENKNLLLSEQAEMISKPLLEVYNDEIVKCTHGATIGHLDENALFYLKSRGISESIAEQMLIDAFIKPTMDGIPPWFLPHLEATIHGY